MPKYTIHAYPVVRVTHSPIEADSPEEALRKLMEGDKEFDTYQREFGKDWEDEVTAYLVDEDGDESREHSRWFNPDGKVDESMHPVTLPEDAVDGLTEYLNLTDDDPTVPEGVEYTAKLFEQEEQQ